MVLEQITGEQMAALGVFGLVVGLYSTVAGKTIAEIAYYTLRSMYDMTALRIKIAKGDITSHEEVFAAVESSPGLKAYRKFWSYKD